MPFFFFFVFFFFFILSFFLSSSHPVSPVALQRRISAAEMPSNRLEGDVRLTSHTSNRRRAERHHSDDKEFRGSSSAASTSTSPFLPLFAERPRTTSPEKFSSNDSRTCDSANTTATTSTNYSHRCPSSETLSQRSSSEPRAAEFFVSNSPVATTPGPTRSPGSGRRSLTASDSSLEEMYLDRSDSNRARRSSRRSRVIRQKRSLPSEDRDNSASYTNVFQDDAATGMFSSLSLFLAHSLHLLAFSFSISSHPRLSLSLSLYPLLPSSFCRSSWLDCIFGCEWSVYIERTFMSHVSSSDT